MAVGSEVKKLSPGDWVYPASAGFGSWQTHAISPESFFMKIHSTGLEAQSAAQLKVNPCTAYRMLKDFVKLDQGQCVIQNGANSAVGLNVIQLSKIWQFKTINVVRKRADETEQLKLKKSLTDLGADIVITEEDLRDRDKMAEVFKSVPKPKLALNCVGGKNATDCMRHLDEKGVMVTYGGMSRQPLVIPTGSLIFRDQRFVGFWMTRWYLPRNAESPDWLEMNDEIVGHMKSGKLKSPKAIEFKLEQFKEAIALATSGNFVEGKPMFVFDK
ncbi:Enoyl-[acyl-carrier-protein] reductase, mitochondrial [Halotydeus destructor]|nr:Enoyl-[acyl-carrier-protein] reductase, mitochondrial [Halotydeus destructor]